MGWTQRTVGIVAVGLAVAFVTNWVLAEGGQPVLSVEILPPVVVESVPQSGDTLVDAEKVKEIRVTFSKDMMNGNWSLVQVSNETFPKSAGKPHYAKDKRTCVIPVALKPGRTYVIWLNSEKFANFKDAGGRSAVPYLLVFETKPVG